VEQRWSTDRSRRIYLAQLAAVVAVYYATGRLGLLVAISPGNVTPLWPPSGISLAVFLLFGSRLWPSVVLGALLVNTVFRGATSEAGRALATTLGIAAGSTLQALAGRMVGTALRLTW
jgi:integral membrane sensor domain MASE1